MISIQKVLNVIIAGFGELLAEGYVILPNIIFAGLIWQNYGKTEYFMAFVLLYAMEKSGVFGISAMGMIHNPKKILVIGLSTALLGGIISCFGALSPVCWSVGAVFIGAGLSIYAAMYRTLWDVRKAEGIQRPKGCIMAGYGMLVLLIGYIFLARHNDITVIFVIFSVVMFIALTGILAVDFDINRVRIKAFLPDAKMAGNKRAIIKSSIINSIAGVMVFVSVFTLRLYKQTANTRFMFWMILSFSVLIVLFLVLKKYPIRKCSLRTFWYGAVRGFVTIFSLIFFMAIGRTDLLFLSYLMIGVGVGLARVAKPIFAKKLKGEALEKTFIICAMLSLFVMCMAHSVTYILGVMLSVMFVSMANSCSVQAYLADETFPWLERRLVRAKFYALGGVIFQLVMLFILFLVTGALGGSDDITLGAYAFGNGSLANAPAYMITLPICAACLVLIGIFFALKRGRNDAPPQTD